MNKALRTLITTLILVTFSVTSLVTPPALAQGMPVLPAPGVMVSLSPAFTPASIKAITINPDNAMAFDFLIDQGDVQLSAEAKKEEYEKLAKYFLASLAIPEEELWVNLSPYEKQRIIPEAFGKTEMGRDLLAMDYVLKQITASLIYPEEGLGKEFWNKVYEQAQKQFGSTQVPVNTFNKVWITPDVAEVYEKGNTVFLIKSHLKVMLEEDYLSMTKDASIKGGAQGADQSIAGVKDVNKIGSQIVREVILPAIEKEVNEGKNFATLRQLNDALILATWYKKALKDSLLGKVYANKGKVKGVDQPDVKANEEIYQQYLKAFKKGVFNFIKEDTDRYTQEVIPRKYFSGGYSAAQSSDPTQGVVGLSKLLNIVSRQEARAMIAGLNGSRLDSAQVAVLEGSNKESASQAFVAEGDEIERLGKKEQVLAIADGTKEIWVKAGKRFAYRIYMDPKTRQLFLTGYSANGSRQMSSNPRMLNYLVGVSSQDSREFFVGSAINDSSVRAGRAYSVNDTGLADTHFSVVSELRREGGYVIRVLSNAPALVRKNVEYSDGQIVFDGVFDATTFSVNRAMTAKVDRKEEMMARVWQNEDQEVIIAEALKTAREGVALRIPVVAFRGMNLEDFLFRLGIDRKMADFDKYVDRMYEINVFDNTTANKGKNIEFMQRGGKPWNYQVANMTVILPAQITLSELKEVYAQRIQDREILDQDNRRELKTLGSESVEVEIGEKESVFLRAEEGSSLAEKDQYSFKISRRPNGRLSIMKYSFDGSIQMTGNASLIEPAGQDARTYNLVFQDIDLNLSVGSQKLRVDVVDRGDGKVLISKMLPAESRGYSGLRYRTYVDHQRGKVVFDAAMTSKAQERIINEYKASLRMMGFHHLVDLVDVDFAEALLTGQITNRSAIEWLNKRREYQGALGEAFRKMLGVQETVEDGIRQSVDLRMRIFGDYEGKSAAMAADAAMVGAISYEARQTANLRTQLWSVYGDVALSRDFQAVLQGIEKANNISRDQEVSKGRRLELPFVETRVFRIDENDREKLSLLEFLQVLQRELLTEQRERGKAKGLEREDGVFVEEIKEDNLLVRLQAVNEIEDVNRPLGELGIEKIIFHSLNKDAFKKFMAGRDRMRGGEGIVRGRVNSDRQLEAVRRSLEDSFFGFGGVLSKAWERLRGRISSREIKPGDVYGGDSAMGTKIDSDALGGIDLNPAFQNLQIKRDGAGVPLPISQQNIDQINLEGLTPVIKSITPAINLPIFAEILSEAAVPQAS